MSLWAAPTADSWDTKKAASSELRKADSTEKQTVERWAVRSAEMLGGHLDSWKAASTVAWSVGLKVG